MKKYNPVELSLDKIVGGGQTIGTLSDGRKLFAWGGLPGERVIVQPTKVKTNYVEGSVSKVITPSPERIGPRDPDSYLSTSPWQIMTFQAEQHYKAKLIKEAFELHDISLTGNTEVYSNGREFHYRNKVEFSWYGEDSSGKDMLHLAFFRRGSKGKIIVNDSALLPTEIIQLAQAIRDELQNIGVSARQLKTLIIRCDAKKNCVWQLYVKDQPSSFADKIINAELPAQGGEVIYSNPKSPASVITKRLASTGNIVLTDNILGIPFRYATESFFQVNIPVYKQALKDMKQWVSTESGEIPKTLDLYSGVGSIGLTIGGPNITLVEINEHAVREMKQNIKKLAIKAIPVLAASEDAVNYITSDKIIIVDPPRAGLHKNVIQRLLETTPSRIIYLSCNPTTQARDIMLLANKYRIRTHQGYNFFPRTPHIEHLVVLDKR